MPADQDPWTTPSPPEKKVVFFISPIGEDGTDVRRAADQVLKHIVRKALPEDDYNVERADEDKHPGAITPRILSKIIEADLVIADLSGYNPNVFYELAVAHGHNKPVVHMQKSDEKAAFDIKDMRIVRYQVNDPDKLETAVNDLRAVAQAALASPGVIETPLTATGKFQALDTSADPQAEVAERLAAIEEKLKPRRVASPSQLRTVDDTFAVVHWIENRAREAGWTPLTLEDLKTERTSAWFDQWVDSLVERFGKDDGDGDSNPWDNPSPSAPSNDPWAVPEGSEDEPPF